MQLTSEVKFNYLISTDQEDNRPLIEGVAKINFSYDPPELQGAYFPSMGEMITVEEVICQGVDLSEILLINGELAPQLVEILAEMKGEWESSDPESNSTEAARPENAADDEQMRYIGFFEIEGGGQSIQTDIEFELDVVRDNDLAIVQLNSMQNVNIKPLIDHQEQLLMPRNGVKNAPN